MSATGVWNIVVKTPMGEQKSVLTLEVEGDALTGSMSGSAGEAPIRDGRISGSELSWTTDIKQPMALTLEFTGEVQGDEISGKTKLGMFGDAPFSGERA